MRAQPELFDCSGCDYQARIDALWLENAEAWTIYQTLCGRTVGTLELHGWLFQELTADRSLTERLDLLARLDVILNVLQPRDETPTHGRSAATGHHD